MSDQTMRRADELLTELVEITETARTVPMSAQCMLPRERVLDLLDALRETLPPEMDQARKVLAQGDELIAKAEAAAAEAIAQAGERAAATIAQADEQAEQIRAEAAVHAKEITDVGRTEHARLVSATSIHQAAKESAELMRAEALAFQADARAAIEREAGEVLADARDRAAQIRADAEAYAAKLAADAETYADSTLAELAARLQKAANTAVQGRQALARRRDGRDAVPDLVASG